MRSLRSNQVPKHALPYADRIANADRYGPIFLGMNALGPTVTVGEDKLIKSIAALVRQRADERILQRA